MVLAAAHTNHYHKQLFNVKPTSYFRHVVSKAVIEPNALANAMKRPQRKVR